MESEIRTTRALHPNR